MVDALRISGGESLVDVGCERDDYSIDIARRTGAHLVGVDISDVALTQARSDAARLLPAERAEFRLGTLTATGLRAGIANAVVCIDAVQFYEPPLAALREFRRLLVPGGRVVLTCWEAVEASDERVSPRIQAKASTRWTTSTRRAACSPPPRHRRRGSPAGKAARALMNAARGFSASGIAVW